MALGQRRTATRGADLRSTLLSTPSCSACSHPERETIDRNSLGVPGPWPRSDCVCPPTGYGEFAKYYRKVEKGVRPGSPGPLGPVEGMKKPEPLLEGPQPRSLLQCA